MISNVIGALGIAANILIYQQKNGRNRVRGKRCVSNI